MKKVFLITGYNNWGKTALIKELFNSHRFYKDRTYQLSGHEFCVQPLSNDDVGRKAYERDVKDRLLALKNKSIYPKQLISAFCPTKEAANNSREIIEQLYCNDEVHLIALEYRWCGHAKLITKELVSYYSSLQNVSVHSISQKNPAKVLDKAISVIQPLL